MPSSVVRIYQTHAAAEQAATELRRHRFSADDVYLVRAGEHATHTIHAAGVTRDRAARYAEAIPAEGGLVIVNPSFGNGALAEEVLDHFHPIDAGLSSRLYAGEDYHGDATPFSRWLGWTVLLHNPEPFSGSLGWSTLSRKRYTFGRPRVTHNSAPLSRTVGLPTLTGTHETVTNTKAVDKLSDKAGFLSDRVGWKTLTASQGPLQRIKLSSDPAPFSRLLGLPVLTKHQ